MSIAKFIDAASLTLIRKGAKKIVREGVTFLNGRFYNREGNYLALGSDERSEKYHPTLEPMED